MAVSKPPRAAAAPDGCCVPVPKRSAPLGKLRRVEVATPVPADHRRETNRLNRIIGQLEGIRRMIEDRRYCPEILVQTRAAASAIRALESSILSAHLRHCVTATMTSNDEADRESKLKELIELFERR